MEDPRVLDAMTDAEIEALDARWRLAWTPGEVAERLSGVDAPWCVAAGWALDLFRGDQIRRHGDLEIAVPSGRFGEVRACFTQYALDAVGDRRIWEDATSAELAGTFQTWVRDRGTDDYLVDVIREPHDGDTWICRRDETIRVGYGDLIRRSASGIPFMAPEYVLLFKAKWLRAKDQTDFDATVPLMTAGQRGTLANLLERVHPGHEWIAVL